MTHQFRDKRNLDPPRLWHLGKKATLVLSVFCIQHLSHMLSKDYAKCHVINYGENPLQGLGKNHQICKTYAFT